MGRGDALALNYEIPQQFVGQQPNLQEIPNSVAPQNPIQDPAQLLAHRERLTKNYFNINSQLDSYVTSMAKDYGIDVTKPDFTQPGGGEAFNTFNKLSSTLLYTANDLARSAKIDDTMLQQSAHGNIRMQQGYDPKTQLSSQLSPEEMFYSTKLDPSVDEANKFLSKEFYTTADAENANAKIREPLINYYNNLIKSDPENAAYYERQKSALGTATKKTPYSAFQQGNGKSGDTGFAIIKEITNRAKGVWREGSYNPVTKGGKTYLANYANSGDAMGDYVIYKKGVATKLPKIINRYLKDPDTGEVTIEFKDSQIPDEVVSNQPGSAIASQIISSNSKYGDYSRMLNKAEQSGILDDSGQTIDELLMPKNYQEIQAKVREAGKVQSDKLKPLVNQTKEIINKIKDPVFGNNWNEFTLPDGRVIQVAKHRGSKEFYIKNYKDILGGEEDNYKNLSADQIIGILDDPALGYFQKYLQPKESGKTLKLSTIKSKVGTPGFEDYTEQELVDYYKSQGYNIQ